MCSSRRFGLAGTPRQGGRHRSERRGVQQAAFLPAGTAVGGVLLAMVLLLACGSQPNTVGRGGVAPARQPDEQDATSKEEEKLPERLNGEPLFTVDRMLLTVLVLSNVVLLAILVASARSKAKREAAAAALSGRSVSLEPLKIEMQGRFTEIQRALGSLSQDVGKLRESLLSRRHDEATPPLEPVSSSIGPGTPAYGEVEQQPTQTSLPSLQGLLSRYCEGSREVDSRQLVDFAGSNGLRWGSAEPNNYERGQFQVFFNSEAGPLLLLEEAPDSSTFYLVVKDEQYWSELWVVVFGRPSGGSAGILVRTRAPAKARLVSRDFAVVDGDGKGRVIAA